MPFKSPKIKFSINTNYIYMYLILYNIVKRNCYIIFYTRNNIVEITFIINNFKLLIINLNTFMIQLLSCKKKIVNESHKRFI